MKCRLDQLLVLKKLADSTQHAQALIASGEVYVDERIADKPGISFASDVPIRIKERCPYVSRGGLKLEKGLEHFQIDVTGYTCLDIGASTGGFTDCLLQNGAEKVFAIDVAYGQLSWKIRQDPKVIVLERFNARKITSADILNCNIHLVVIDVSFISLNTILPPILPLFSSAIQILALIKPQFELAKSDVPQGGVITDPKLHQKAIDKVTDVVRQLGLLSAGVTPSPILGPKGNKEFLILITSPS